MYVGVQLCMQRGNVCTAAESRVSPVYFWNALYLKGMAEFYFPFAFNFADMYTINALLYLFRDIFPYHDCTIKAYHPGCTWYVDPVITQRTNPFHYCF